MHGPFLDALSDLVILMRRGIRQGVCSVVEHSLEEVFDGGITGSFLSQLRYHFWWKQSAESLCIPESHGLQYWMCRSGTGFTYSSDSVSEQRSYFSFEPFVEEESQFMFCFSLSCRGPLSPGCMACYSTFFHPQSLNGFAMICSHR